ncbi:MAG TPA: ATP-dependent protease [Gammaproteobacteria bacterium]|nr:ATP-dependent protease [Gammaproteobacteria bacterium]
MNTSKLSKRIEPLSEKQLYHEYHAEELAFSSTADLKDLQEILGQERAKEAIEFAVNMQREGYNLFVMGAQGSGRRALINHVLESKAAASDKPNDLCYVNNFISSHKPKSICLPSGYGRLFSTDMQQLVRDIVDTLPAVFAGTEYMMRLNEVLQEAREREENAFSDLSGQAKSQNIVLMRTNEGVSLLPSKDGQVLSAKEFANLPEQEQQVFEENLEPIQRALDELMQHQPLWEKELHDKVRVLDRLVVAFVIHEHFAKLETAYRNYATIIEYLKQVREDIIDNIEIFKHDSEKNYSQKSEQVLARYEVNVLVDNSEINGAPVIYEEHPLLTRLMGSLEFRSEAGNWTTDYRMLRAGSLHRANGGYLIIDAERILTHTMAWEGLKRTLRSGEISIASLSDALGSSRTPTLEPACISLNVKVILVGSRRTFQVLNSMDPDFTKQFRVVADLEDEIDRTKSNNQLYAQMLATVARREQLRPFSSQAIARLIEFSSRVAGHQNRMSLHMATITNLMYEANYVAGRDQNELVELIHVDAALAADKKRDSRIEQRMRESIFNETVYIDTSGAVIGQVNGLAVRQGLEAPFGMPARITATVRPGKGEFIDIEREVELSGSFHAKGILILNAYLASRYSSQYPLSLDASLVFEQSYGPVDGDSATIAECCALLSSIAREPIKQSFAVTGSMDQFGRVQAIGGVNEKIEGFFEIVKQRGFIEPAAVIIPRTNVQHLMLDEEVRQAIRDKKFTVYAVSHVDEAFSLLTDREAGESDKTGRFMPGTLNALIQARLEQLAKHRFKI